jgi:dTDP-4-dehydrorhamnose 3,5-epimerase-like enzyme
MAFRFRTACYVGVMNVRWNGLRPGAREALTQRNYSSEPLSERLSKGGVDAGELVAADPRTLADAWIPGVEIFPRRIHVQRHRGTFGELARAGEGEAGRIGLWPRQWAAARMFAGTAKGFHVHPPYIPDGTPPGEWFKKLYLEQPRAVELRPYDREQWDLMCFLQGSVEMFLVDEREGMPRRVMRFWVEGDDQRGASNVSVVIPPGVAHALRADASRDVLMVYGTSTVFEPEFEGRIADDVERAVPPEEWAAYLSGE